jgi:hypothetical protein
MNIHSEIVVTAASGGDTISTIDISVGTLEAKCIPTEAISNIFELGNYGEGTNNMIMGFKDEVIADPTLLKYYNSLDFSEMDGIEYVDGDCKFNVDTALLDGESNPKKVFDVWKPLEINFGDLTFLPNTAGQSGFELFKGANLNSLTTLNFGTSKWASPETYYSASNTFSYADLSGVEELSLSGAVFATSGMSSYRVIYTASNTFNNTNLSNLTILDLNKTVFAASGMTGTGDVYTGSFTFSHSNLGKLEELKLGGCVFAASGMTGTGRVFIGSNIFSYSTFSVLETLDLSEVEFAVSGMTKGEARTASNTFSDCKFEKLEELDLQECVFAASGANGEG